MPQRHPVTHSIYRAIKHGPAGLPAELRDREIEMLTNLGTTQGIVGELERQVVYQMAVTEAGFTHLRGLVEAGVDIWACGEEGAPHAILKMLGSWSNGVVRSLAQLAALRGDKGVIDMASGMSAALRPPKDKTDE